MGMKAKGRARKKPVAVAAGPRKGRTGSRDEKLEALVGELKDVAEAVGIRVRRERLKREVGYSVRSGLCRVNGEEVLLLESDLSPDVQVDLIVGVLAGRDLTGASLTEDMRRLLAEA
jgi:hypothetical protein